MIHGVKEQQDFSNGLKTIIATDAAFSPLRVRRGEWFPPSQVWVGGNSRKSSETTILSITTENQFYEYKRIDVLHSATVSSLHIREIVKVMSAYDSTHGNF